MHAISRFSVQDKSGVLEDSVENKNRGLLLTLAQTFALLLFAATVFGQETTAGLQGTVKDPSGAVVSGADVSVLGTTLIGTKDTKTDGSGYYRFANLPPGTYTITASAKGFSVTRREGVVLEVGHLPSVDLALKVGGHETIVEVSGEAPAIDVT